MRCFLALKCHFPEDDMIVNLTPGEGEHGFAKGCIYENGLYSITFAYYGDRKIKEGEVYIEDQLIAELENMEESGDRKSMRLMYKTHYGYKDRGYPFLMLLDSIRIKLTVTFEDGEEMLLTSNQILVVTKNAEDRTNIAEMLHYIDGGEALRMGIFKGADDGPTMIFKLNTYLAEVITFFERYGSQYVEILTSGNRKKEIGCCKLPGIHFALGSSKKILGVKKREAMELVQFLRLLFHRSLSIYQSFVSLWDSYRIEYTSLKACVPEEFSAPILTAHSIRSERAARECSRLSRHLSSLLRILKALPRILGEKSTPYPEYPREQYANPILFDLMVRWPLGNQNAIQPEDFIFQIDSLNKLYEYYCLVRLLRFFSKQGYVPDGMADDSFHYETKNMVFENEKNVLNTYYRRKGEVHMTLYFQPLIYRDRVVNGLELVRTTGADSNFSTFNKTGNYYSPDFIIKMEGHRTLYLILDAKFQTRHTILKGHMDQVISKYYTQVRSIDGKRNQKVYILQGRTDTYTNNLWSYENSDALGEHFISDFGILQFSPDISGNGEFQKMLLTMENYCMKKEPIVLN
ncbi:MAG: hypothetical protein Q4Q17_04310 [Tissierellia bacterium]|nr:hypothetical protein [Tissierellia bacterium]